MKGYFRKDLEEQVGDIDIFLKEKYDLSDDIFEKRFEKSEQKTGHKAKELENLINDIAGNIKEVQVNSKMLSLVLGNAYMRLAQCQNELFEKSRGYYEKAIDYLEEHIDYSNLDEIDLLLMLNKGKYFRNTAEIGRKRDYERAYSIFNDVAKSIKSVNISYEKKFHLLLDAKINIGRVRRYAYEFEQAQEIFLSLILALEKYLDNETKKALHNCNNLETLLQKVNSDTDVKEYSEKVNYEDVSLYSFEYLLQALIHIGIIYRKSSEYEKAQTIFDLINKISGNKNIDASNNLGVCHRKLGDLKGRESTEEGKMEYDKALEIFKELDAKGNKFASINLYKCQLGINCSTKEYENIIENLKKKDGLDNSFHLQFLLGRFYAKIEEYDEAMKIFESIYMQKKFIARGSIGFKAYYNFVQCKIKTNEIRQARNILKEIRKSLLKNNGYIDKFCEMDYGYCLIKEGRYKKALEVYKKLLVKYKNKFGREHLLEINNNMANCYIHQDDWDNAKLHLEEVFKIERDNEIALYLMGVILLNQIIGKGSEDYKEAYNLFDDLISRNSNEIGINSGWLISALLLYDQTKDQVIKRKIIKRIKYLLEPISMKSFFYLSEFIINQLNNDSSSKDSVYNTLYRDFCHIKLIESGENKAFQRLMESVEFHFFEKKDRAYLLANIAQMYKYVLDIKKTCRFVYDDLYDKTKLPYHYTKLNTLNHLLSDQQDKVSKLRLWNTAYMNDAYEGRVFDKLLSQVKDINNEIIEKYFDNLDNSQMQTDSNVYITSFSTAQKSFQMWNIYGDNEKGVAIKFDEDFFDIKDKSNDLIMDDDTDNEYALYKVQYLDIDDMQNNILEKLNEIGNHMILIESRLRELCPEGSSNEYNSFTSASTEVRLFITDRLNEVRFLFKSKSYEYENELRLIRCSHKPCIDAKNFTIPRLYINVEKEINNLEVKLGGKLEKQQIKDLCIWLKNTGKIKHIEVFDLAENSV